MAEERTKKKAQEILNKSELSEEGVSNVINQIKEFPKKLEEALLETESPEEANEVYKQYKIRGCPR